MHKMLLASILFLGTSICRAQTDSVYAEILVFSFTFENDTLKAPKQIILRKTGCTEIVSLGEFKGIEVGIQTELIRSSLGRDTGMFISGLAFFTKKDGEWKMSKSVMYQKAEGKMVPRPEFNKVSEADFNTSLNWRDFMRLGYGYATADLELIPGLPNLIIKYRPRFYFCR